MVISTRRRVTSNPDLPGTQSGLTRKLVQLTITINVVGIKDFTIYGIKILSISIFQVNIGTETEPIVMFSVSNI